MLQLYKNTKTEKQKNIVEQEYHITFFTKLVKTIYIEY